MDDSSGIPATRSDEWVGLLHLPTLRIAQRAAEDVAQTYGSLSASGARAAASAIGDVITTALR